VQRGHWSSNRSDRQIFGQRVVVQRIAGAETDVLDSVFVARSDSSVLVVPWDYDPSCRPTLWGRSFMWTPPDSFGVFIVQLRPRHLWAGGVPTFDARQADIQPYPHAPMYAAGYRETRIIREGGALSVAEYFEFWLGLPTISPSGPDSLQYRRQFCEWAAMHPHAAQRWPASRLVSWQRCG
jgi:hypothetical protein